MRVSARSLLALLLSASIALPPQLLAQQAEAPSLAGAWEGWARLTNDVPGLVCRYQASEDVTSVRMELTSEGGALHGSLAIDLPAEAGSGCPPLRKRYAIADVASGANAVSFADSGGNEWTLSVRRSGNVLHGMLAWQQGGPEQPLAEGFTLPDGVRPASRLSGEVHLRRAVVEESPTAAAPADEKKSAPGKTSLGGHAHNLAIILGANLVGLGLLYGVNKLGKGSSSSGTITCSPRTCIVGPPNAPCFCESNSNVITGASCGNTTAGQPLNAPCDGTTQPCQSGLSCNNNICEDRYGRCPY